ncbi:phosphatidylglycerophosphatase A-like protein [Opitutaceae bacterium TAV1]|nr:phosphatidylglycerophosphatase A-like protein [Opitutaceae bacterium TAV1]
MSSIDPGHPVWPRFLPTRAVLALALVGPVGRAKKAPGTWGSLAGAVYSVLVFYDLHPLSFALLALAGLWLAVGICGEAELRLGRRDPGCVVLDEFMAMPLCYIGWHYLPAEWVVRAPWAIFLAGFLLFRVFDIAKPFGISRLQKLPAGWGVVVDDVAAALAACAVMHAAGALFRHWDAIARLFGA